MIKLIEQSWGGFKVLDDDKFLGIIEKVDSHWETNQGETFPTKKLAIQSFISQTSPTKLDLIKKLEGWVTVEQIRNIMTDLEFKQFCWDNKIIITQMNLGQPRMGSPIFGNRQFNIKVF